MNPSRIARCRQAVIDAGVKSEILIKTDDLQAAVEAAELALVLELKQQGVDALTAMSEERYWQEAALTFSGKALTTAEDSMDSADCIITGYRNRYGEKPEQPTATVVRTIQRPEPTPAVEVRAEQDPRPWVLADGAFATWHNFRDGHFKPAVCGAPPIPGTPSVSEVMPSLNVCTACAAVVAEPQPDRKGLEWRWNGEGTWFADGTKYLHRIDMQVTGKFRVSWGSLESFRLNLSEAKAWCQEQEDELLTQQEAEQEGKSDA